MSILKSTHAGYKYTKWKEDLHLYAEQMLRLSEGHKTSFRSCLYRVPVRKSIYTPNGTRILGEDIYFDERWFSFNAHWDVARFIAEFELAAKNEIRDTGFELEDVFIPSTSVIEG